MGAGSIGCYVGGQLQRAGVDVTLVGRPRLGEELASYGLKIRGVAGEGDVPAEQLRFRTTPDDLADREVVLVAVKSAQTDDVGAALRRALRPDALVVSLQNGLRNATALASHLGEARVVPAIVGFNVVSLGAGVFHSGMSGPLVLERRDAPAFHRLVAAARATGLPLETPADIAPEQYTKLLVNLNNAVSALSGAPTRDLLLVEGYRRVVADLVAEGHRVIRAAGGRPARLRGVPVGWMPSILRMPTPLVRLVTRAQMKVDPKARSSMWEDLTKGRPTEVDFLNGEIVRLATEAHVEAPLNRRVVELIRQAEAAGAGSPRLSPEDLRRALE